MVYYGALSKGCQRCRQRKIKCDQRKPGCLRCEKSETECPGYRNLDEVLFRDESERVIAKARPLGQSTTVLRKQTPTVSPQILTKTPSTSSSKSLTSSRFHNDLYCPLAQPINELGAHFFFTKYSVKEPPFASNYHDWLTQSYFEGRTCHVLRAAVEAVGLAGISNVFHEPQIVSKSKELYCKALASMRHALNDPDEAIADTTFMAVILLGIFETVNFETWSRHSHWVAHIEAATAILELRGQEQFTRERGGQLYVLIRSQIQQIAVPPALVRASYNFETSAIRQQWQHRNVASSGSISEISFRIVNLRAAFKNRGVKDPHVIRKKALEIDEDLENWRAGVPTSWRYNTIDALEAAAGHLFDGKSHLYPNIWIADAWNNWRILRILVNQIIVQNELRSTAPKNAQQFIAISVIRQLSTDVCISTCSFTNSPRLMSLIEPLYIVSLEDLNARSVRYFAVEQLRRIDASMGIRRAGLLADTVSASLKGAQTDFVSMPDNLNFP